MFADDAPEDVEQLGKKFAKAFVTEKTHPSEGSEKTQRVPVGDYDSEDNEEEYEDDDDFDEWSDPEDRGLHPNRQTGGAQSGNHDNKASNQNGQRYQQQQAKFQNLQKVFYIYLL